MAWSYRLLAACLLLPCLGRGPPQSAAPNGVAAATTDGSSPPIRARVQASWSEAPIVAQILESVSLESPDAFFPLLDAFLNTPPNSDSPFAISSTSKQSYDAAFTLLSTSNTLSHEAIESLKLSLALKEASPRIETHYQLWNASEVSFDDYLVSDVDYYGLRMTEVEKLDKELAREFSQRRAKPRIYPFDHVYPSQNTNSSPNLSLPVAVLYASPWSLNIRPLHAYLSARARESKIIYVFRWKPPKSPALRVPEPDQANTFRGAVVPERTERIPPLMLSGWGAGLDLKRVDYLTIDDRDLEGSSMDENLKSASPEDTRAGDDDVTGSNRDGESVFDIEDRQGKSELVQLKPAQIDDIGLKAAQLVLASPNPLTALKRLSQDFPRYAHKLVISWVPKVNMSLLEEVKTIQSRYVPAGQTAVWLNGLPLRETDMKPFILIRLLRKERKLICSLMSYGLTNEQALDILANPAIGAAAAPPSDEPPRGRQVASLDSLGEFFDASDASEVSLSEDGQPLILYWNDIEKDSRYKRWPSSLQTLLQPQFPGQLPTLRRNAINVVLVLDLKKKDNHAILAENIAMFINRGLGIRFGLIPLFEQGQDELGESIAKAIWYLVDTIGRAGAVAFSRELASSPQPEISHASVRTAFDKITKHYAAQQPKTEEAVKPVISFEAMLKTEDTAVESRIKQARAYNKRLGLKAKPTELGNFFVNGKLYTLDEEFQRNLQVAMNGQMQYLTQQYYMNEIDDSTDLSTFFYAQPSTYKSRNALIFADDDTNPLRFVDIDAMEHIPGGYCEETEGTSSAKISLWLLVNDVSGQKQTLQAAQTLVASSSEFRVCLIHLKASDFVPKWVNTAEELAEEVQAASESEQQAVNTRLAGFLGLSAAQSAIIINGRLLTFGLHGIDTFDANDFGGLLAYEGRKRVSPLYQAYVDANVLYDNASQIAKVSATIAKAYQPDPDDGLYTRATIKRSRDYRSIPANFSSVVLGDEASALFRFAVIMDPLADVTQSWSAILETLSNLDSVSIRLYLNPALGRSEMPLKRFYRYSIASEPSFDDNGSEVSPSVRFQGIPQTTLLTLAMDTPGSWQAFPKQSVHDLDNIRLSDLKPSARIKGVDALFELSNIIVEGHARESKTGMPPRGLQIVLSKGEESYNTLVMANLGYHQLKANPGVWDFTIREGRSSEVFKLESLAMTGDNPDNTIAVTTFEGITVFPRLGRLLGMEGVDLLDEEAPDTGSAKQKAAEALHGLKNKFSSFFGKAPAAKTDLARTANKGAEINIFTVASGLLYERMAMIMILSVLKHTESTVKFWFINNFLSPSFKAFIPHLAREYKFDYELITYTWPHWLRSQTEKQRTIWGYKILFLDVLFPLELDRVIFVDSDQIVRTDLKQLVDLDLKGAPYAYTPMGDDREEMEAFRFWKSGYWRDHLRGLPYHISALYVIDLDRFRQIAAGDRLRGQYQGLSADPNSLANLDQDLPNNMQAQLPIYTLDRSWLWCETWCSDESLKDAKTIDLCNNPKTHEPKLARAKRLIPEWTVYDKEVADLASRIASEQREISRRAEDDGSIANSADSTQDSEIAADAFADEAGQLEQARMQQKEFVEEGTGAQQAADSVEAPPESMTTDTQHRKDEL